MPSQCELCRRWGGRRICDGCVGRFAPAVLRCPRCALRLPSAAAPCADCARRAPAFGRTVCIADYGFPWDRLVAGFKFHGRAELATALADRLVERLQAELRGGTLALPQLVVPVPLHAARLAERGYNQAWELARACAAALSLPARDDLLQRALPTAPQAGLTRGERLDNLRAAFFVDGTRRPLLDGRTVALVDDVMTTGATAEQCARALLRAGASDVQVWVLARTPAD